MISSTQLALPKPRRTRSDVVEVAGRLFAERGFHGTSMRDLGTELGLLGSSLYAHIGSKDELLVEIIRGGANRFQSLADRVLATPASPLDKLRSLIDGHVGIIVDAPDMAATYLNEARFLPEETRAEIIVLRDRYQEAFRTVVRDGCEQGTFRVVDEHLTATFILSVLNAVNRWYRPSGRRDSAEISAELQRFVIAGIVSSGPDQIEDQIEEMS